MQLGSSVRKPLVFERRINKRSFDVALMIGVENSADRASRSDLGLMGCLVRQP